MKNLIVLRQVVPFLVLLSCSCREATRKPSLETDLLNGNWEEVIKRLQQNEANARDPLARLIMGHAFLATNKNNESLVLFGSVDAATDLQQWLSHTRDLTEANPKNHIAHYLLGDAYARLGKYAQASTEFSRALEIDDGFAMALVGKGVALASKGEMNNSLLSLTKACSLQPELAEVWAELGVLWIKMAVPEASIEASTKALLNNKDFAAAHLAKGVALYGQGKLEDALMETETARVMLPYISNIAERNIELFRASLAGKNNGPVAISGNSKQGTTMEVRQSLLPRTTWNEWFSNDSGRLAPYTPPKFTEGGQLSYDVYSTTGPGKRGGRGGGVTRPPSWMPPPKQGPPPIKQPKPGAPFPDKWGGSRGPNVGGVSTKEIENTWVEHGEWTQLLEFGLLYRKD